MLKNGKILAALALHKRTSSNHVFRHTSLNADCKVAKQNPEMHVISGLCRLMPNYSSGRAAGTKHFPTASKFQTIARKIALGSLRVLDVDLNGRFGGAVTSNCLGVVRSGRDVGQGEFLASGDLLAGKLIGTPIIGGVGGQEQLANVKRAGVREIELGYYIG